MVRYPRWILSMPSTGAGTSQQEQSTPKKEAAIPSPPTSIDKSEVVTSKINTPEDNTIICTSNVRTSTNASTIQELSNKKNNNTQDFPNILDDTPRIREIEKATLGRRLSTGITPTNSRSVDIRRDEKKKFCDRFTICNNLTYSNRFWYFLTFLLTLTVVWYAAALLFTKAATVKYSFLFWGRADGQLEIKDDGQLILCQNQSICSEGLMQITLIGIARLTAYASYVYVGLVFISKMNNLTQFLSSTYLQIYVPFHAMHHIHTNAALIYFVLILLHGLSHYIRYILRGETLQQLGTPVHVSGCIGLISLVSLRVGIKIPNILKKYWNAKFEYRLNSHWVSMITLVVSLCYHNVQTLVIMLVLL